MADDFDGSVNDVGPVVQADGNGVGNSGRDTAKNCWRAGDPASEVTSCNFLPLREQFHYSARQRND